MKKITVIIAAIISVSMISCKKSRTCFCSTYITSSTGVNNGVAYIDNGPFTTSETTTVMTKVTKKTAQKNCVSGESTKVDTDQNNGNTKTVVTKNDCEIK